jgi:hypothetical protein
MIIGVKLICRCIEKYITSLTHSKAEIMALMLPVHSTALSTPPLVISTSTWRSALISEFFVAQACLCLCHDKKGEMFTDGKEQTSCTGLVWSFGITKSVHPNFLAEN